MKNLSVRFAKLVGTPTTSSWPQIHTFTPEDSEKRLKRGTLMVVLTFSGFHEESEMATIGKEIISRLHEEYFGDMDMPAMACLSRAVKITSSEFNGENSMVDLVGGVILENVLYLVISGNGQAWIKRGNVTQKVLQGKYLPDEVTTGSGFIKQNDLLVLGTKQFFSLLPEGVFRASLENEDPDGIVEAIAPIVYGKEETPQVAALVGLIQAGTEEVTEIPEDGLRSDFVESVETKSMSNQEEGPRFNTSFLKRPLVLLRDIIKRVFEKISQGNTNISVPKNKKVFLSIAGVIIVLLVFSLFMVKKSESDKKLLANYQTIYEGIKKNLDEGKALVELNPSRAKELFSQAKNEVKQLTELKIEKAKTEEISRQIDEVIVLTVKEYNLSTIDTFFDLGLIRENGRGEKISIIKNTLLVSDKSAGRVYGVDLNKKSGEVVAGSDLPKNIKLLVGSGNFIYCLGDEGISRTDLGNGKTEIIIKTDSGWEKINDIKSYLGNLYLLDSGAKNIWRYTATGTGFSSRNGWIQDAESTQLDKISSFAVDGSVWMVDQRGGIFKFVTGTANIFSPKNMEKPLSEQAIIYTDESMQNLYILDKGNKRLVVIKKSGEYNGQYISDKFSNVSDFVVKEDLKKVFLLQDNKIFQFDLKI